LAVGGDNSNSQFALLGLYEAERAGAKVQERTWQMTLDYWKSAQNASDGSFGYYRGQSGMEAPGTGSMTCAGIASLAVVSAMAPAADATIVGDKLKCCNAAASDDSGQRIRRALNWLSNHFTVEQNPIRIQMRRNSAGMWHYYYLWDLADACRLTGQRVVGDHDWYREGAAFLCRDEVQQADGGWRGEAAVEADPNIATSFALLFISEGRRPLAIAKLQYGRASDWNHHRHDAANLAHYIETKWRKDFPIGLSWQAIEIGNASAENLLDSPVLFISGSEAPEIGDDQAKVLREYIDRGGYVFAEASCSDGEKFDRGFRELVKSIVPEAALKPLAGDHRIWGAEEAVPADKRPQLLGIDINGRTRIIYSAPAKDGTAGLSCCWELAALAEAATTPPAVAARIAAAKSIGLNIIAYATERKLRTRHESLAPK
jgi:hypothetical protein